MPERPTLRYIASLTKLSHTTVSLALRNHPRIPQETRERVLRVADEIGYRPDPVIAKVMSRLRTTSGQAQVIAFVTRYGNIKWKEHPVFARGYAGMKRRAEELGYRLDEFPLKVGEMSSRRLSEVLYNRGINGAIISGDPRGIGHLSLDLTHLTAVCTGHSLVRPQLHRVAHHQSHGIQTAMRKLRRFGYKRIGFVIGATTNKRGDNQYYGGMSIFQASLPANQRVKPYIPEELRFEDFAKWIKKEKPDAIVHVAKEQVPPWLRRLGIQMPEDIQIASLDLVPGDLSAGIDQRHDFGGIAAVDLLASRLYLNETGVPKVPTTVLIEGEWIDGVTAGQR